MTLEALKKNKGKVAIGISIGLIVEFVVMELLLVTTNYSILFGVILAGMILTIGLSVYFFIKGKDYTGIGLIIFLVIDILFFLFFYY
ncbi:hypothetical protein [Neobacillus bataviensis]|uniref:hypothetical protein n=1 Tax=Neobacillus bataviensis TaxID=220685 RepID=UPI001CBAA204|nr:hypothetical protein [Neobacillus bataviensis]